MIWTIIIVLAVLWVFGYRFHVGGNLVHTLLVVALIVLIAKLLS